MSTVLVSPRFAIVGAGGIGGIVGALLDAPDDRVVLVSSLCSGRWIHPLNLFGLILIWKGVGERWLQESGLRWTVVRPGGLKETEDGLDQEGVVYTGPEEQDSLSIPRRLVARVCLEALETPAAEGRILEITSRPGHPQQSLGQWLAQHPQPQAA